MGVQLPRSPVRLSLFRCSSLFVSLSDSLCFVVRLSLFRCPASLFRCSVFSRCSVPLSRLIGLVLFLTRVPYIYYLFSIWEINPVESLP